MAGPREKREETTTVVRIASMRALLVLAACAASTSAWATEEILARTSVPNAESPVGEVRLLRRDDMTVVQTLLVTRLLPRVAAEIGVKEERNWPPDRPGYPDRVAYVTALTAAAEQLRAALPAADARTIADADRRMRLLIEFSASASTAAVEIAEFTPAGADRPYDVATRRRLAAPAVGRPYVLGNMRLILADAFGVSEAEVDRVGTLGPAAAEP